MAELRSISKKSEICTLLFVLGSSAVAACCAALAMLYYYNPPGTYLAGNMLVEPASLASMHYSEATVRGGDNTPFVFAGIEFSFYDESSKLWRSVPVANTLYAEFYSRIAGERSVISVSEEIKGAFLNRKPSSLIVLTKRLGDASGSTRVFVKVDFAAGGNLYRIEERGGGVVEGWVYYDGPGDGFDPRKFFTQGQK